MYALAYRSMIGNAVVPHFMCDTMGHSILGVPAVGERGGWRQTTHVKQLYRLRVASIQHILFRICMFQKRNVASKVEHFLQCDGVWWLVLRS